MPNLEQYLKESNSELNGALEWLEKETSLRTNHARMLSGPVVGQLLTTFVEMLSPTNILEIGTFTGYSAICLALGLKSDGHMDALEINDKHENLILEAFSRAGVSNRITMHFGDAKEILPTLNKSYDLVYIDGNKREYCAYYDLVFPLVREGGYIIADNVLWDGKVYAEKPSGDAQTQEIIRFNKKIKEDRRVGNFILPLRDGLSIINKLG